MRHRSSIIAPLLLCIAMGPASAQTPVGQDDTERVVLEHAGNGLWRATYYLAVPTRSLEFQRPAGFYRERAWTVVTPGYEFERRGDYQLLAAADGTEPVARITVEFPEFTEQLTAEYEFFVPFTDGGRAIYTGHLYAAPDGRGQVRTIHVAPAAGERLIVRDGVYEGPLQWSDEAGDGTYFFFGGVEPIETDAVIAVFDRALPEWLREEFGAWIPRLLEEYTSRLGVELPWKPVVLYGYQASDLEGLNYGGGTLTGLIQMTVSGSGWDQPSDAGRVTGLEFVAHEVAHLWNGQLVSNEGSDSWTHEGSADAFAARLLLDLGVIGSDELRARRETALNDCLLRLGDGGVDDSTDPRVPYVCGHAIAMLTETTVAGADEESDLFSFWGELIDAALGQDGRYDGDTYLEVLNASGASEQVIARLNVALTGSERAPSAELAAALEAADLVERGGTPTAGYRRELARRAMGHIMAAACDGGFSYSGVERFRTYAMNGCETFSREYLFDRIEGVPIATDGDHIYDRVVELCRSGGEIELAGPEDSIVVPCGRPLAARPEWVSVLPGR